MCEPTVLRILVSLRETFYKTIYSTEINKYDEDAVAEVSAAFAIAYHVTSQKFLSDGAF